MDIASRAKLPVVTLSIVAITGILTGLELVWPRILTSLDRRPEIWSGQWWRLITPIFVQAEIWPQYVLLAMVAVLGRDVERGFGRWRWLVIYFAAGVAGEVVSLWWKPRGAGASVALCGLIGATGVMLWQRQREVGWPAMILGACFIAGLAGSAIGGKWVGFVLVGLVAGPLSFMTMRGRVKGKERAVAMGGLLGAVVLAALRDQHGPPIIAGAIVAIFLGLGRELGGNERAASIAEGQGG